MIARALAHSPRLLILNEPTAGVDIEIRRSMWDFLRAINQQGTTIILTTHYLEEAENLCRHIAIIDNGKIVEHSDMAGMLRKLSVSSLILELKDALVDLPAISGYPLHWVDTKTIRADVPVQLGMNGLFQALIAAGVDVVGVRNAYNRLEQLFMGLVESRRQSKTEG